MDNYPLKEKTGINIAILAKTLEDTNSSYKFFWLYSLLEILKQREYKIDKPIAYKMFTPPSIDLAEANGFEGSWYYKPSLLP